MVETSDEPGSAIPPDIEIHLEVFAVALQGTGNKTVEVKLKSTPIHFVLVMS
jgi:hypothetical protein